jgi:hypothetical protein
MQAVCGDWESPAPLVTCVGTIRFSLSPNPSCPHSFRPHTNARPSSVIATQCAAAAPPHTDTIGIPRSVDIRDGSITFGVWDSSWKRDETRLNTKRGRASSVFTRDRKGKEDYCRRIDPCRRETLRPATPPTAGFPRPTAFQSVMPENRSSPATMVESRGGGSFRVRRGSESSGEAWLSNLSWKGSSKENAVKF